MNFSQFAGINWKRRENILFKLLRVPIVILISGILFVAAFGKLLDNRHFAEVLAQWQLFPSWSLLTHWEFSPHFPNSP